MKSTPSQPPLEYVACPDLDDPEAFAARIQGDSMQPKYREGDIVIFSPAEEARSGDDCFVKFTDGVTMFRRAFFEGQQVRLQPRNVTQPPQMVRRSEVRLTKAVFKYQRVNRA